MGYTIATIEMLVEQGYEVHVVHWDDKKLTPYKIPVKHNVFMYKRSELSIQEMKILVNSISPVLTVVSGWMDRGYMSLAKMLRNQGRLVVVGFDDQWHGTFRQRIGNILFRLGYLSKFYSHAWVTGVEQFEYARRLGFSKAKIIYDLYSADLNKFNQAYDQSIHHKKNKYPHRFLFVGRFEKVKGLNLLLDAWQLLGEKVGNWELHLVGNGSLKIPIEAGSRVVIKEFMQPDDLAKEVSSAGCFVLPSRAEPWGVVVHEFTAAGLPLILSDTVGSASSFLIEGLNGYKFNFNDSNNLASKMLKVINMTDDQLHRMALNSHKLSQRITPETSAANLLAILH